MHHSRSENAEGDIWQHTINNEDYPLNWVFNDDRFQLSKGPDEIFLKFLCEVFHPEVRDETQNWMIFLNHINELLRKDGYELYTDFQISGREVYDWRNYKEKTSYFIPFSVRNKEGIQQKRIALTIPNDLRYQLRKLLQENDEILHFTDSHGWNYEKSIIEVVFDNIKNFYVPKSYQNGYYSETEDFDTFIHKTSPFSVLDLIEFFNQETSDTTFPNKVNELFNLHNINLNLING